MYYSKKSIGFLFLILKLLVNTQLVISLNTLKQNRTMKNQLYEAERRLKAQCVIRDSGIEIITSISPTFSLGI